MGYPHPLYFLNMITKIYKASSIIAVNLSIGSRKLHIKFDSDSNGRGYFITSEPHLMKALDEKLKNGSPRYYLAQIIDTDKVEEIEQIQDTKTPAKFEVGDIDNIMDAKDYLCDRFEDITRSSLKTKKSIFEAAEAHNIIFTKLQ